MNTILLKAEKYLILVPVTLIAIPGLLYMVVVPLSDLPSVISYGQTQKLISIIFIQVVSLLSMAALFSIWFVVENYLNENVALSFSDNPYAYIGIIIGICISVAAVVEILYPDHYLQRVLGMRENTALLGMYVFGVPVCIPAVHMLVIGRINRSERA